ncbi:helix-turn-helix transcriptional regulator [Spirillospora sp. NPDC049652]
MTRPTVRVLEALLADPSREYYGLELREATGLGNGTLYPRLAELENYGWLESRWETPVPGRPPRRYYRLTRDGAARARTELARVTRRPRPVLREA